MKFFGLLVLLIFIAPVRGQEDESRFLMILEGGNAVSAVDNPNDAGEGINLVWELAEHDSLVAKYEVFRSEELGDTAPVSVGFMMSGRNELLDNTVENGIPYYYFMRTWYKDGTYFDSEWTDGTVSSAQWFHTGRKSALVLFLVYAGFLFFFLRRAKRGKELEIRRIAGLEAIDDAVGRSTELGRPILFTLGLEYVTEITTLAGLALLKRVAYKAAEYEAEVIVPNFDPIVMVTAKEVCKEGYFEAGRPDLYNDANVYFLTSDQFGYAAGVDGIMLREKPGAVFLQGYFYAESLILAETGHSIGAIQISGTTAVTQLPFFIAATDYTLIGEEMLAASAYLSRDPMSLSTIVGEDWAKVLLMITMVVGAVLVTVAVLTGLDGLMFLRNWFTIG
jgi:hypothetical protein